MMLVSNCSLFMLQLLNKILIGNTWAYYDVVGLITTIITMVMPFIRSEGLSGYN